MGHLDGGLWARATNMEADHKSLDDLQNHRMTRDILQRHTATRGLRQMPRKPGQAAAGGRRQGQATPAPPLLVTWKRAGR